MESKSVFGRPAPDSTMWKSLEKARRRVAAQEQAELQARYDRVHPRRVVEERPDLFDPQRMEKHRRRLLRAFKGKKH